MGPRSLSRVPHKDQLAHLNTFFLTTTTIKPSNSPIMFTHIARRSLARNVGLAKRSFTCYSSPLAGLTADQEELREAVASWAQAEVAPLAQQIDKEDLAPMALWKKIGDMGLHGITVPEDEGGLGKGYLEHTVVMEGERGQLVAASYKSTS